MSISYPGKDRTEEMLAHPFYLQGSALGADARRAAMQEDLSVLIHSNNRPFLVVKMLGNIVRRWPHTHTPAYPHAGNLHQPP
jgi:hypothetical protein